MYKVINPKKRKIEQMTPDDAAPTQQTADDSSNLHRVAIRTPNKAAPQDGDRFIPFRQPNDLQSHVLSTPANDLTNSPRQRHLRLLFGLSAENLDKQRVLYFSEASAKNSIAYHHQKHLSSSGIKPLVLETKLKNNITLSMHKILDAPGLSDNFYSNTLAWSSESSRIYAAVSSELNTWSIASVPAIDDKHTETIMFDDVPDLIPNAIATLGAEKVVSGWEDGSVLIYTLGKLDPYQHFSTQNSAIDSIAITGPHDFVAGYANGLLGQFDLRIPSTQLGPYYGTRSFEAHLAGLAYNGAHYLACGNSLKRVEFWDRRKMNAPIYRMKEHSASVKALAFDPQNPSICISGGGTACKRLYKTHIDIGKSTLLADTAHQVTGLHWFNGDPRYLVSSYGYGDKLVEIWSIKNSQPLSPVAHESLPNYRAISLVAPKTGNIFAAGTSNEQMRFFKAIGIENKVNQRTSKGKGFYEISQGLTIR